MKKNTHTGNIDNEILQRSVLMSGGLVVENHILAILHMILELIRCIFRKVKPRNKKIY